MLLKQYTRQDVNGGLLKKQIKDSNSIEDFAGMTKNGDTISVYGKALVDESLLDSIITGHNHLASGIPRIIKYQIDKNKDFRTINHNTELIVSLDKNEIFGLTSTDRGLLIKKEYSFNNELLFHIDYEYEFDTIGQISRQKIILKWYNEDGTMHEVIKDKGFRTLSKRQSRKAVKNRRSTVIMLLEIEIMNLLLANATNQTEYLASIDLGAAMLTDVTLELDQFKNSGNSQPLITKLGTLTGTYTFLTEEVAPGVTALAYITDFFNY